MGGSEARLEGRLTWVRSNMGILTEDLVIASQSLGNQLYFKEKVRPTRPMGPISNDHITPKNLAYLLGCCCVPISIGVEEHFALHIALLQRPVSHSQGGLLHMLVEMSPQTTCILLRIVSWIHTWHVMTGWRGENPGWVNEDYRVAWKGKGREAPVDIFELT
jgi:hypothetical protein